jgi:GGDEF domain-containing protein
MASEVAEGSTDALIESRATLRGLLREYRENASKFLSDLREELAANALSLEEVMVALAQADGDQAPRLRAALAKLRESVNMPERDSRALVASTADAIDQSLEEMRHHHQLTISQFQAEVRMLHKRIDSLKTAAAIDSLTKLFNRAEMEQRIRSMGPESCLLMMRVSGLRKAEAAYQPRVAVELAGAFTKRLRNTLPGSSVLGRWDHEEFLAIVPSKKPVALGTARWIAENLSGSYSCMQDGKAVRPSLQLSVGVLEHGDTSEALLERVSAFFRG